MICVLFYVPVTKPNMSKKGEGEKFKGIKKYFNSETVNGRANVTR